MFDFPIYTSISNKSQLNQLAMFVGSFTKLHKMGHIVCVLNGVDEEDCFQAPRLRYAQTLPSTGVFISVDNFFLDKIYALYVFLTDGHWQVAQLDKDLRDFTICKSEGPIKILNPGFFIANFNISPLCPTYLQESYSAQVERAITINTKDFNPASQVSSFYSNVFVWTEYHAVLQEVSHLLDQDFYAAVSANCQRYMR